MADGRHFENRYISISQPRMVRIWRNLVCGRKFWPRRRKCEKIPEIPRSKMADGRHTENHFLAITRLHVVRLRRIPTAFPPPMAIEVKFCTAKRTYVPVRRLEFGGLIAHIQRFGVENGKFRKSNMADGLHFPNRYSSISHPWIVRIWRSLVRKRRYWARRRKRDKNSEISKFKVADGRIIDDHLLAIPRLHIFRLIRNLEWGGRSTRIRSRSGDQMPNYENPK